MNSHGAGTLRHPRVLKAPLIRLNRTQNNTQLDIISLDAPASRCSVLKSSQEGRKDHSVAVHAVVPRGSQETSADPSTSMPEHVRRHIERVRKPGIRRTLERYFKRVQIINGLEPLMRSKTDEELRAYTKHFRERLASGADTLDSILPEAFAVVREAARRTLGLRHYDVQLVGGMVLQDGLIAEMMTGEGKTLMATLPAYLNALEGKGVHVVTVNEYLARRDCDLMGRVYGFLGIDALYVPREGEEDKRADVDIITLKRRAYAADITYVTSQEICFDYLRSNTTAFAGEIRVMRPFNYCIVDEADFVLIDSALQPMLITEPGALDEIEGFKPATKLAAKMVSNERIEKCIDLLLDPFALETIYMNHETRYRRDCEAAIRDLTALGTDPESLRNGDLSAITGRKLEAHYSLDKKNRTITLTDTGARFAEAELGIEDLWSASHSYARILEAALKAKEHFINDKDYIVKDGEVVIIDPGTGRAQPRTRWRELLHAAVEAKEGLKPQPETETSCQITYQAFFRLYRKLSGMSGTAQTEEEELYETYGLSVVPVPTNKPMIRIDHKTEMYINDLFHKLMVYTEIEECHWIGRPILVGTGTVDESEFLAKQLADRGIPHEVLNARPQYEEQEAGIIAQAGSPGAVTISTNMAGRGTDIVLGGDPSGLVVEHLRVWLMQQLDRTNLDNGAAYVKFIARLRKRISPPTPVGMDPVRDPYCNWDFLFPLLRNPLSNDDMGMTPDRATALGYLMAARAAMLSEEASFSHKDISSMMAKAMEIKELIKIRVRSLLSAGLLPAPSSGSSEYVVLANRKEDWDPILGQGPQELSGLGSLEDFAADFATPGRDDKRQDGGIAAALQQYSRSVQALGKAAYILEGLLSEICDQRAAQVRGLGGLLVLSVSMQNARRLENQLRGRAGRQGDPGETRSMVSLEDPMIVMYASNILQNAMQFLYSDPNTGQLINAQFDWESNVIRPVQGMWERHNFGGRSETRLYGDVLGPYSIYMNDWRRRLLLAPPRDERRFIHSLLQFKADELVAKHLGPGAADKHPSRWSVAQLQSLQSELLQLMAPSLEGFAQFAAQPVNKNDPLSRPTIFFYCTSELADRAELQSLVQSLCGGQPIPPILPHGSAGSSLVTQSLFHERWTTLTAASGVHKELARGLPLAPLYVSKAVADASNVRYQDTGTTPDPDPWQVRNRPEAKGRYLALYEMFRLLIGDLLVASYEERYAAALREANYVSAYVLRQQSTGKVLDLMTQAWKRFLSELEELRTTVTYRAFASLTPLEEYRIESATLFVQMVENIRRRSANALLIFDFVIEIEGLPAAATAAPSAKQEGKKESAEEAQSGGNHSGNGNGASAQAQTQPPATDVISAATSSSESQASAAPDDSAVRSRAASTN